MLRRFAAATVSTGLAGLAVAAAAGAVLAGTEAAAASTAPKPTYVAIVISGHGSACVKWKSGITGDTILNAVATVHYRPSDHLIDQIDGTPSPAHADATHYWSYWHDTGASWTYSTTGASGSTPAAGTVEGWSYVNGSSTASPPARAPKGLYAALCGRRDPAAAPPAPTVATPTSSVATRAGASAGGAPPVRRSGATEVPGVARPHAAAPTGRTSAATSAGGGAVGEPPRTEGRSGAPVPGAGTTASAAGVPIAPGTDDTAGTPGAGGVARPADTAGVAGADAAGADTGSHGALLPVLVAVGLVALLGAAAAVTARRRGHPAAG